MLHPGTASALKIRSGAFTVLHYGQGSAKSSIYTQLREMEFYNVFLLPSVTYRNSTYIVLLDDLSEAYVDRT